MASEMEIRLKDAGLTGAKKHLHSSLPRWASRHAWLTPPLTFCIMYTATNQMIIGIIRGG